MPRKKKIELPKKYISYSAWQLWKSSKTQFRDKYYEGKKSPENIYSIFGREVHKKIEIGEIGLPPLLHNSQREVAINTHIEGIPVLAYVDILNVDLPLLADVKTGKRNKDGESPWTELSVYKHEQLPFYALAVEAEYGVKIREGYIFWLETGFNTVIERIGSREIETDGSDLVLTGHSEIIRREIYENELEKMRADFVKDVHAISEDWKEYRKK